MYIILIICQIEHISLQNKINKFLFAEMKCALYSLRKKNSFLLGFNNFSFTHSTNIFFFPLLLSKSIFKANKKYF